TVGARHTAGRPREALPRFTAELCGERLEGRMKGKFIEPAPGFPANTISYEGRRYTRREMADSTPEWRRYDRDYAVLVYRQAEVPGEPRRLAALAGIGSLGTLLLTTSLAHAPTRALLAQQARALAPLRDGVHRPSEWLEVLVGFQLREPSYLENLLSRLD